MHIDTTILHDFREKHKAKLSPKTENQIQNNIFVKYNYSVSNKNK